MGPAKPYLDGAWWAILHIIVPLGLVAAVVVVVAAGFSRTARVAMAARRAFVVWPLFFGLISAAVLVCNFAIRNYHGIW
jgi:hypothetical protein